MTVKPWFERPFVFDLPPWMFPNVLERLRGTPARAEDLLAGLSPRALTRADDGKWSIQRHLGHLLDLETLWLGRVDDLRRGAARLRDADLTNRATDEADHDDVPVDRILRAFRTARARLVARLEPLDEAAWARSAIHPRLEQPMRLLDHAFFVAEHDDHHLATISALGRTAR